MSDGDNTTLLLAPSSLQPDNYTLPPNASGLSPGPDFPVAPASSAAPSPSPGLSLGPSPSVGFSPGPSPTAEPTAGGFAGGAVTAVSAGASPFPRPWVPHEPAFWDTPLSHGLNVFVGAALCITMLGLGCTVDVNHFGAHVRRPVGALLAALCQFGLLPLLAFLLALLCSLDEVAAVAVLLCGCCPGGNLSNLMSLLVDGDMNLRYGAGSLGQLSRPTSRVSSPGPQPEHRGPRGGETEAWSGEERVEEDVEVKAEVLGGGVGGGGAGGGGDLDRDELSGGSWGFLRGVLPVLPEGWAVSAGLRRWKTKRTGKPEARTPRKCTTK